MDARTSPSRLARTARALLVALATVVLFVVLFLGTVVAVLRTPVGSALVLRQLVPRVNAAIRGHLAVDRVQISPVRIAVFGLVLRDPSGAQVATLPRVELRFSPLALLHHRLVVSGLEIDKPRLDLRRDRSGKTNIGRALARRTAPARSKPESSSGSPSTWDIAIDAIVIHDADLAWVDESAGATGKPIHLLLDRLVVAGTLGHGAPTNILASLDAQAMLEAPVAVPIGASMRADATLAANDGKATAQATLSVGASRARVLASAELRREADWQLAHVSATLAHLAADAATMRTFVPAWPVQDRVEGSGRATWDAATGQLDTRLDLALDHARAQLDATANLRTLSVDRLTLAMDRIDLHALSPHAPTSDLSLRLHARGRGRGLDQLRGNATLDVAAGMIAGRAAGPIHLSLLADPSGLRLRELSAELPGARVTATGGLARSRVDLRASIDLRDLGALLAALPAPPAQPARGRGQLAVSVSGDLARPAVRLAGQMQGLAWGQVNIPSARLKAYLPDLRNPVAIDTTLSVPEAQLGSRHVSALALTLRGSGARFVARLSLARPEPLSLSAQGSWRRGHHQLTLGRMTLALARAVWSLEQPVTLTTSQGNLRLPTLRLVAAPNQSIALRLDKRAARLDLGVDLSHVDLAALPRALWPGRPLAGRIDVHADISRVRDRANGSLDVQGMGMRLRSSFAVPTAWPPPARARAVANVDLDVADLHSLVSALAPASRAAAFDAHAASLHVQLAGTTDKPQLVANLKAHALAWQGQVLGDGEVELHAVDGSPITARLRLGGASVGLGQVSVDARSEARPSRLLGGHSSLAGVTALPFTIDVETSALDLARLGAVAGYAQITGGTVTGSAQLEGTGASNHGHVDLHVRGLSGKGVPPTDGDLRVEVGERDVQAQARIVRRDATLASLRATLAAPWRKLLNAASLPDVGIDVHASVGPLEWQHTGIVSDVGARRVLRGRIEADLDLTGSPREPRLRCVVKAPDIRLDQQPVGAGAASVSYQAGVLTSNANLVGTAGGRLLANASTSVDLGYPGIRHLPPAHKLPLDASLHANDFDLAALSGMSPLARTLAGRVQADVIVSGSFADPRPSGRLEWKEGQLVVAGVGDYTRIHLLVHGDPERLTLDELRADSGPGHVRLAGVADHQSQGGYRVQSTMNLDKLPAYMQGQLLAHVSLDASADTQVGGQAASAGAQPTSAPAQSGHVRSRVTVHSAHVALAGVKRKHLQPLSEPGDVIVLDKGKPASSAQARKLATTDAALKRHSAHAASAPTLAAKPAAAVLLVDAPRDLWIKGDDANIEIGLAPGFRIEIADKVHLYGQVEVKRGYVQVFGRHFDLKESSSVSFSGPPERPALDVTAQYVSTDQNVTVVATVKGTPGHLQTSLTAPQRSDLTESQLYTLLITGHLTLGGSSATPSTPTGQAESLLGGLLASQLQSLASSKLPFDVLTVQPGASPGSARIEAGKYVTSDLYVAYVGRLGADPTLLENRNAVHLEYDLGARWSFQGEYGDAKTGTLDLFWTKRY